MFFEVRPIMGTNFKYFIFILIFLFKPTVYANSCVEIEQDVFNSSQYLISVIDTTDQFSRNIKTIHSEETIDVEGLTLKKFREIGQDPEKIAQILGAKLIEQKSNTEFKIAIPGILGFDLNFWVDLDFVTEDQINIKMERFNTFISSGVATISFKEKGAFGQLVMNGDAIVPNASTNMFIFGLGGQDNFERLLQKEINQQISQSLERYHLLYPN